MARLYRGVMVWLLMALPALALAQRDEFPVLTISVLQFGTAHWELDHLLHQGLDKANGYRLELLPVANLPASRLAVASGTADGAVADLLWAQARYQAGAPYLYLPFSSQIGDIMVADASDIRTVADLAGKRIGVAGGPDSKGWILLNQVAALQGVDLSASSTIQFAAPPLLGQALKRGQLDAIVTYWHFAARLRGEGGWRSAFRMADLLATLGLDRRLPVLGYVFPEAWARNHPALLDRFADSLAHAKSGLETDPVAWQRLRRLMGNPSDGGFDALRQGFVDGFPGAQTNKRIADLKRLLVLAGAEPAALMRDELFYRWQP